MSIPAPDDGQRPRERPLSVAEQQAFDRIQDSLAHGDAPTRTGWRHDYVTVRLPKLRAALVVVLMMLVLSILAGAATAWMAVAALLTLIVGLPLLLLYATGQHKSP